MISVNKNIRVLTYKRKSEKRKGYIQLSTLLLFAFSSCFFSRVLLLLKFPSIVTLLYLVIVPSICIFTLVKTKVKDRNQIAIVKELFVALVVFFAVNLSSGILNNAGLINVCLNCLFFCAHFLFLIALISLPLTPEKLTRFRAYIVAASFANTLFAYVQRYGLRLHLRSGLEDNIKGVFIEGGAGHVLGASVALTFGVYYFVAAKNLPLWFRVSVVLAMFWHMNMADAKQVMLVFMIAGLLLLLLKLKDIGEAIKYLTILVVLGYAFFWATQNIPALSSFNTWMRPEIYGPEGEATLLKTATFRIVPIYYDSLLHPWLGLGPGHTVGRLGGWMLAKYANLLEPLGSTTHPASRAVWQAVGKSWLGDQSSMFSPFFGWAAIWGDLGWLGLGTFFYIWFVVWRRLCFDDVSKFLALTPLVFGLIFTQMEEPGYTIYVATIIGLRWQERQCQKLNNAGDKYQRAGPKRSKSIKGLIKSLLLIE